MIEQETKPRDDGPPFKMTLSGASENITKCAEHLVQRYQAEVVISNRGRRATLKANVPQQHARAAMLSLGLVARRQADPDEQV
jgi:hypothetical protein